MATNPILDRINSLRDPYSINLPSLSNTANSTPSILPQSKNLGVQAKTPVVTPPTNKIAPSFTKTTPTPVKPPTLQNMSTNKPVTQPKPQPAVNQAILQNNQGQQVGQGVYLQNLANQKANNAPKPVDISNQGILQKQQEITQNPNPIINKSAEGALGLAQTNLGNTGPAYDAYQQTLKEIQDYKQKFANVNADIGASGVDLSYATGQKANLGQQYQSGLAALEQRAAGQASALGYGITGQNAQTAAFGQAGNTALGQQQALQSGMATGLGAVSGIQAPYGTPIINPITGQNINMSSTGVQPTDPFYQTMQQYAELMASNQGSAVPGTILGNPVLNAQLIQMAKQINPAYNVNVASGAGSAQAGAAGQQAGQIQNWTSALQQAQNLQTQLTDLLNTFGLNPSDINKANQGLQTIANNVSDPRYQTLQNYINDIANTYAQVLTPSGGSQTNQTRDIASSMLNSTMSGNGLITVMQSLDEAAKAKIAGVSTSGGLGGGSVPSGDGLFNW